MATQSNEIQKLLAAEKKAAEVVAEARKKKTRRLKQAKDEAVAEIEAFKAERERAYKALEQQILGSKTDNEDSVQKKTELKCAEMTRLYEKNKQAALNDILEMFFKVDPEVHKNFTQQ